MLLSAPFRICIIFGFFIWARGADNIAFELSDLTRIMSFRNSHEFQLEAFKSINNDKIMKEGNREKYSRLFWVSLGFPRLLKTISWPTPSIQQIFHEQKDGFYSYIQTLTQEQRLLLLKTANIKYNVNVTSNQIVHLVLEKFTCNIQLFEMGKRFLIKGEVSNFHYHPLRMDFMAPLGSRERRLFKKELELYRNGSSSIRLKCSVESPGQRTRVNTLTITSKRSEQLGIKEKLFGPSSKEKGTVYVTRKQINALASELFSSLSIVEEYEMPEYEFSEAFVQEFIKKMAQKGFAQVPFENALSALSKYKIDFSDDLKPDIIKGDMGQIFKIVNTNNKSHIVVNEEQSETWKDKHSLSLDVSANAGFLGIFDVSASVKTAYDQSKEWTKGTKSLTDQIRDMNHKSTDKIEWIIEGTKVVPKSINVAKIDQANFVNTLRFERIRRYITDAPFQRKFSLYAHSSKLTFFRENLAQEEVTSMCDKAMEVYRDSEVRRRIEIENVLQLLKATEDRLRRLDDDLKYPPALPRMMAAMEGKTGGYPDEPAQLCTARGDYQLTSDRLYLTDWKAFLTKKNTTLLRILFPPLILPTYMGGGIVGVLFHKQNVGDVPEMELGIYFNSITYNKENVRLPVELGLVLNIFDMGNSNLLASGKGKAKIEKFNEWTNLFKINTTRFIPDQHVKISVHFFQ